MENFKYEHGITTDNDIIEFILKLLTENPGQPNIVVSTHCHIIGQSSDNTEMIGKIVDKLLKYDLAQTDLDIYGVLKITSKGREVYRNGRFAFFLQEQQKIETEEKIKKEYKRQLEVTKSESDINRYEYDKTNRKLLEDNSRLINDNQRFQKYKNIKDLILWLGVPFGWFISHYKILEFLAQLIKR